MKKSLLCNRQRIFLLLILFLGVNSCKKEGIPIRTFEIISEVPANIIGWYNKRAVNNSIIINSLHNYNPNPGIKTSDNKLILKPDWAAAKSYIKGDSTISEVPVSNKGRIAFSTSSVDPKSFDFEKSASFTQFLFIQTPKKIRGVYMTIIADEGYLKGNLKKLHNNQFRKKEKDFSGVVLYHTIKGTFLNGYRYKNGVVDGTIHAGKVANLNKTKTSNGTNIKVALPPCQIIQRTTYMEQCTDWYTTGGTYFETTCEYWSVVSYYEECSSGTGGGGGGGSTPLPTTDPGPDDPCGGSSTPVYSSTPSVSVLIENVPCEEEPISMLVRDIIIDLNDPNAKCILANLFKNAFFNNTLSSFQNNAKLNVTFKMGAPVDGSGNLVPAQTSHASGTTNFTITMGQTFFDVQGGIEVAKTFMHEAIHANLWIKAKEWYPTTLPAGFQNLSLIEQVKWLDNKGGNGALHHEYMAANINNLANGLRSYVQANYPALYGNPNITFDSYKAMAFTGLIGTAGYNTYVNSLPGGQAAFNSLYGDLVIVNKCP